MASAVPASSSASTPRKTRRMSAESGPRGRCSDPLAHEDERGERDDEGAHRHAHAPRRPRKHGIEVVRPPQRRRPPHPPPFGGPERQSGDLAQRKLAAADVQGVQRKAERHDQRDEQQQCRIAERMRWPNRECGPERRPQQCVRSERGKLARRRNGRSVLRAAGSRQRRAQLARRRPALRRIAREATHHDGGESARQRRERAARSGGRLCAMRRRMT